MMDRKHVNGDQCEGHSTSQTLTVDTGVVLRKASDELTWSDSHFAEPDKCMFHSLQLNSVSETDECFETTQPRSLDDISSDYGHQSAHSTGAFVAKNGQTDQRGEDEDYDDDDDEIDMETLKNKFLSAWTNAKNGWIVKTPTSFKPDSPIWLLGCMYIFSKPASNTKRKQSSFERVSLEDFKLDFKSRLWFTYRKDLPVLPDSHLKSDVGWGCMLRCGQMLLAQAFIMHFLRREWRWSKTDPDSIHRQIVIYFGDTASPLSPFSIQKLISLGRESGRKAGDWYGPASIAHALRAVNLSRLALTEHQELNQESPLTELCVYVARDGVVYTEDLLAECTVLPSAGKNLQQSGSCDWRSTVVLIPMRLGGEGVNPMYIPCLKTILSSEFCIGIIGGKPKHSLYFVGWQEEKLIYLDPHCCQDFVDVQQANFPLQTFHCMFPRKLSFGKMDPSCAIGFYCRTRQELDKLLKELPKVISPPLQQQYPLFHIDSGRHCDAELLFDTSCTERTVRSTEDRKHQHVDTGDFTLL